MPKVPEKKPSLFGQLVKAKQVTREYPPHLIVTARAGTGKTTTMIEGIKYLKKLPTKIQPSPQQQAVWDELVKSRDCSDQVCFVAFNKSIADKLKREIPPGCEAMTCHSLGFRAINRSLKLVKESGGINQYKTSNILAVILGMNTRQMRKEKGFVAGVVGKLVGLCKQNLTGGDDVDDLADAGDTRFWGIELQKLCNHYQIELEDEDTGAYREVEIFSLVPQVLHKSTDTIEFNYIDFDDMVWLPTVLKLPVYKYDMLLVDECLPGWTPVMMADGKSKEIKDVQIGDKVRSYNTSTGRAINCEVSATQKLPNKKPLVKIKVKHVHKTEGNRKSNFVVCTTDHKIWTTNRGWIQAGDIQIGDSVIVETAAATTQKGKISKSGRNNLSTIHVGNKKGNGNNGGQGAEAFNKIKGGNGRGPTTPQKILHDALGKGWNMEWIVTTGGMKDGLPHCYKIDIANPEYKIAIEVDGKSHTAAKEIDDRKDNFLRSNGWTVFRVTNRDIAKDFAGVLQDVCPDGTKCPMPAIVESVEETYITEHHVYDITVKNCHNFYANGILVHNCQDLNKSQHSLIKRAGHRLILVGDDRQAIYGFAGADSQSMTRLKTDLVRTPQGCTVLPLTVTRRCGKAIVTEAQKYVPEFEAHESNGQGLVTFDQYAPVKGNHQPNKNYRSSVQDADMVICRCNAPLVTQCFAFLKEGRRARIQGRDIGQGLISLIESFKASSVVELSTKLELWYTTEVAVENSKENPSERKLMSICDKVDCLRMFISGKSVVDAVVKAIEVVFTDDPNAPGILLSSIHRAKGLEADTVWFLMPETATCPHPMAKSQWEYDQEINCLYIGITRAKSKLVFVVETPPGL